MNRLAYRKECEGCRNGIVLAICRDGRWRAFESEQVPAAPREVWAWRKQHGMEEQEIVPGHRIHYCAQYHHRMDIP